MPHSKLVLTNSTTSQPDITGYTGYTVRTFSVVRDNDGRHSLDFFCLLHNEPAVIPLGMRNSQGMRFLEKKQKTSKRFSKILIEMLDRRERQDVGIIITIIIMIITIYFSWLTKKTKALSRRCIDFVGEQRFCFPNFSENNTKRNFRYPKEPRAPPIVYLIEELFHNKPD